MATNLVNTEAVGKAYGTRVLLHDVSLGVAVGERVGVVGRNGDGKTTLLQVLARREPVEAGRVTHAGGLRLGLLAQGDDLDPADTVRTAVLANAAPHEWAADPRVRDVLTGLFGSLDPRGFPAGLDTAVGNLSGGERRRVALAQLLIRDDDLLLLDEPTNHLDVEGVAWLAAHLSARRSGLVVVTHDRWFLDETCTRTWEVAGGRVHEYDGGYSAYVLARAERERLAATTEARRRNLLRKELAWLRRGPPARSTKPRFRVAAATALIADEPPARDPVELQRFATARLGRTVYDVEDATVVAGGRAVLERLSWLVGPGDRIGVVGANGSGKTTLLRLLAGRLRPAAGRVVVGRTVRAAYLSQQVAELDPAARVREVVEEVRRVVDLGNHRSLTASQLLDRFGFTGDRQWTPVRDLSGGERRRLQLLRLLMEEPNVLLLDEPTNDLDIDTLTALEDLLDGWAGTLLVASHDRYFLERVTDRTIALFDDGQLRELPGGVEEYLRRRPAAQAGADGSPVGSAGEVPGARNASDARAARKELARVERALDRVAERESRLHEELAAHATDHERVLYLDTELKAAAVEREQLEETWLALVDAAPANTHHGGR